MLMYHGSSKPHAIGSVLKARKRPTEWSAKRFAGVNIEKFLESVRPKEEVSRLESIFMVKKVECLNLAGASEDYIYRVEPKGHITQAHFGWISYLINLLLDEEEPLPGQTRKGEMALRREMFTAADNYWAGAPCVKGCKLGPSAWEYLTKEARIVRRCY